MSAPWTGDGASGGSDDGGRSSADGPLPSCCSVSGTHLPDSDDGDGGGGRSSADGSGNLPLQC